MFDPITNSPENSKRPGIAEMRDKKTGNWYTLCVKSRETKEPHVYACVKDAIEDVKPVISIAMCAMLAGRIEPEDFPQPEDFRFRFVDAEPDGLDAEVTDTSHADFVIRKIQERVKGRA